MLEAILLILAGACRIYLSCMLPKEAVRLWKSVAYGSKGCVVKAIVWSMAQFKTRLCFGRDESFSIIN